MPRAKVRKLLPSQVARPILLWPDSATDTFEAGDLLPRSCYVVSTVDPRFRQVFQRAFWGRKQAGISAAFDFDKSCRPVVMTGAQVLKHIKDAGLFDPKSGNTDTRD